MEELNKVVEPVVNTEGKTYTEADLQAKAKAMATELTNDAIQDRLKREREKFEIDKQKAVDEAIAKTKMSDSEKLALELDELRSANKLLEDKLNRGEKSSMVIKKLMDANIPADDDIVDSLISNFDKADSIIEKLNNSIKSVVDKQVEEKLKGSGITLPSGEAKTPVKSTNVFRTTAARIGVAK